MTKPLPQTNSAFTLIEILVVIAIIAVLAAIAVPTFNSMFRSSAQAQSASNLRQWGSGVMLYAADNGGKLPPVSVATGYLGWDSVVSPYLNLSTDPKAVPEKLFIHPKTPAPKDSQGRARRTYAMARGNDSVGRINTPTVALAVIPEPSKTILLTERLHNTSVAYSASAADLDVRKVGEQQSRKYQGKDFDLNPGGKFHYLFVDGHVELLRPEDTVGSGSLTSARGMWTITPLD
jgi:prepilin-type N-terminal cleavage/methylation domain-containing protein/prepilin-type processing-associated H-X9-DG protein